MMTVAKLLPAALKRLVTIEDAAPLIEAVRLLSAGNDSVVVRKAGVIGSLLVS